MTYASQSRISGRRPFRFVELDIDYCPLRFGEISIGPVDFPGDDWFLPSRYELEQMYNNLHDVGIGGFQDLPYWSSSEDTTDPDNDAVSIDFATGVTSAVSKSTSVLIRPVRTFAAMSGMYSVGDVGPSGGWIFYILGTLYFEARDSDLTAAAWSDIDDTEVGTTPDIGAGFQNTLAIIAQGGHTTSAAQDCRDIVEPFTADDVTGGCAATGTTKCYNTRVTCAAVASYRIETKTYRFCDAVSNVPPELGALPTLVDVRRSPARLDPAKSLGKASRVSVTIRDHPHHDIGIDKYVNERDYDPMERGTFWGKFQARNPYHQGRRLREYTGYIGDAGEFDINDFIVRTYFIDSISGPVSNSVRIEATDVLKKVDDKRAVCPQPSPGRLETDIADGAEVFNLLPEGIGSDYPAPEVLNIIAVTDDGGEAELYVPSHGIEDGDSVIVSGTTDYNGVWVISYTDPDFFTLSGSTYTSSQTGSVQNTIFRGVARIESELVRYSRDGDEITITLVNRGIESTTAVAHSADTAFQACVEYRNRPLHEIMYDLIKNYAFVDDEFIPLDDWEDEVTDVIGNLSYSAIIAEPVGVRALLDEMAEQFGFYLWWDERIGEIKLRVVAPAPFDLPVITDQDNIIEGSFSQKDSPDERLTQIHFFFDQRDPTKKLDEAVNYRQLLGDIDIDAESPAQYGDRRVKKIFSRWLKSFNFSDVYALLSRINQRYRDTPKYYSLRLDAKDGQGLWIGDRIYLETREIADYTGAPLREQVVIIEAQESEHGTFYDYEMMREYAFEPVDPVVRPEMTGGTVVEVPGYRVHRFETSGILIVTKAGFIDYLVVAGGGGGGAGYGGGGAGGCILVTGYEVPVGAYSVTVGAGGAGAPTSLVRGSNGGNSQFIDTLCIGGGGGGSLYPGGGIVRSGADGGSGGGSSTTGTGGSGVPGQGNNGGASALGGGGGGVSERGYPNLIDSDPPGSGGNGIRLAFWWTTFINVAGGGGRGAFKGSTPGVGRNGGGDGGSGADGEDAEPLSGSGGGGGGFFTQGYKGGNGGSGVVYVRYRI